MKRETKETSKILLVKSLENNFMFKLADRMRSIRTTGASKNPDSCPPPPPPSSKLF